MIDNILNSMRRGVDRARVRGEEVAQITRLRFEVYSLSRELDALYGRLGRAYHSGADVPVLQPIQSEISRLDEEISARERLISEISVGEAMTAGGEHDAPPASGAASARPQPGPDVPTVIRTVIVPERVTSSASDRSTGAAQQPAQEPTPPASVAATPGVPSTLSHVPSSDPAPFPPTVQASPAIQDLPSAASVWGTKQSERVDGPPAAPELGKAAIMDPNKRGMDNREDLNNQDYQDRVDEGQGVSQGTKTDADLHGSSAPIPKLGTLAGNAQGIDRAPVASSPNISPEAVHDQILKKEEHIEADRASRDPDPLD